MLTTEMFVALVGLCARFYTIGYTHGQCNTKTKKQRIHIGLSLIWQKNNQMYSARREIKKSEIIVL